MKKLTFFAMLLVFLTACGSDKDAGVFNGVFFDGTTPTISSPTLYTGIAVNRRQSFFYEGFDNNNNRWEIVNSTQAFTSIQNGQLTFQSRVNEGFYLTIPAVVINRGANFEIEALMRVKTSNRRVVANSSNGLLWFYDRNIRRLQAFSFLDNRLWIGKYSGNWVAWQDWLTKYATGYGSYNKLTIRRAGSKYYFFMNEQLVVTVPYEEFTGNSIGFQVAEYTTLEIDYLKIDYFNF